ncbi:hypothetical protein ANN_21242 [Periplaneta americana]|uniref:Odorant receptor n=1 Tax=Periplaneta americana TaxID=6978 RepID=A0ABQ8SFH3_PERAM|nr:hypothetical protein ANN_21242 [Periplaneta americana]
MGESRNAYRVLVGRPEGKIPLGRPKRRWENNIKMDLREAEFNRIIGKRLVLGLKRKARIALYLGIPATASTTLIILPLYDPNIKWWHILLSEITPSLLWMQYWLFKFTCEGLRKTADVVGDDLVEYITVHVSPRPDKISQYRHLWVKMSELTQDFGSSHGIMYGNYILIFFVSLVLYSYGALTFIYQEMNIVNSFLIGTTIGCIAVFYKFCSAAQNTTTKVLELKRQHVHIVVVPAITAMLELNFKDGWKMQQRNTYYGTRRSKMRSELLKKKIKREGVCAGDEKLESPEKKRPRELLIIVDDMNRCILRRKIQECYSVQKEVSTLKKLLKLAKEVQCFFSAISSNPPVINFSGFVEVNLSLCTSVKHVLVLQKKAIRIMAGVHKRTT